VCVFVGKKWEKVGESGSFGWRKFEQPRLIAIRGHHGEGFASGCNSGIYRRTNNQRNHI